jgi:O-antigen ligase
LLVGATIYRWATSVSFLYWATGAATVFIGIQIFHDARSRGWYLRALVVSGFVLGLIAPLQLFTADAKIFWLFEVPYSNVAMGPFVYPNQYAAFIELVLPIALTGIFWDRTGWRTFHGLAAVLLYASLFASVSRTGFVLASLEVLVVPVLAAWREGIAWRRMLISGGVFLCMLTLLGLAVGPEKLITKLQQKDPYQGRREYAESSLRMIRDKPLIGVGLGNWPTAYPAYATFDNGLFANQAHNDWAQWAVEGGLPFAFLMLAVAVMTFRAGVRTGWGIGPGIVFLHCFVDYPIQRMGVAVVFFSLLGAIFAPGGPTRSRNVWRIDDARIQ